MALAQNTRETLLDAAIRVLAKEGARGLAQPRVAQEAGLRQSHLTYYFPRKRDLLEAVLQRFLDGMLDHLRQAAARSRREGLWTLHALVTDLHHMRMLAGLTLEAESDRELREILQAGILRFDAALAEILGRRPNDPSVRDLMSTLWGLGLRRLLTREKPPTGEIEHLLRRFERSTPRRNP
jgi:AcrR family transcriptional regulator